MAPAAAIQKLNCFIINNLKKVMKFSNAEHYTKIVELLSIWLSQLGISVTSDLSKIRLECIIRYII